MRSVERGKISSSTEPKLPRGMYVRITHSITPETRNEEAALIHCNMTRGISVFIVALHFVIIKHTLGAPVHWQNRLYRPPDSLVMGNERVEEGCQRQSESMHREIERDACCGGPDASFSILLLLLLFSFVICTFYVCYC